jgi:hypothetical protein
LANTFRSSPAFVLNLVFGGYPDVSNFGQRTISRAGFGVERSFTQGRWRMSNTICAGTAAFKDGDRKALMRLFTTLGQEGIVTPPVPEEPKPHDLLLRQLADYLERERGLSAATILHRRGILWLCLGSRGPQSSLTPSSGANLPGSRFRRWSSTPPRGVTKQLAEISSYTHQIHGWVEHVWCELPGSQ